MTTVLIIFLRINCQNLIPCAYYRHVATAVRLFEVDRVRWPQTWL